MHESTLQRAATPEALPDQRSFRRTLRRATLSIGLALGIPALGLLVLTIFLLHSAASINRSDRIISEAGRVQRLMFEMEIGFGEFLAANDPRLLEPFRTAEREIGGHLEELGKRTSGDKFAAAEVPALETEIQAWIAFAEAAVTQRQGNGAIGTDAAIPLHGRSAAATVHGRIGRLIRTQEQLRSTRSEAMNQARWALFAGLGFLALAGAPLAGWWLRSWSRAIGGVYQASLTAAERRAAELHVTLRSIGDAVIATDARGDVVFLNPVAEQLTGWTTAEARGRPLGEVFQIFNEQTGRPAPDPVERVLRERVVIGLANHTVIRSRSGTECPIEDSAAPIVDDTGEIHGVILVFHNVGDRREVERRLHEAEWQARTALEVGRAGFWSWDIEKDLVTGDAMLARSFNFPIEQCVAGASISSFFAAIHEDDRARVEEAVRRAAAGEGAYASEYRIQTPDGGTRWVHALGRLESDAAGRPVRLLGFLMDVTATRGAEMALRQSEERFRFLNDLGEATRALTDPKEIMAKVALLLGTHLHVSRCAYADVEADGDHFTIQHDYTDGCASTVGTYQLALFGPRAAAGMRAGETLVIRDTDAELAPGEGREMFNAIGVKAIVCCPLVKRGGLHAMMAVHQLTPRIWTGNEISLVEEVVDRSWATIERARAETEIRERARLAALRAEVAAQLAFGGSLEQTLQGCCELLVQHIDAATARVWTMSVTEPVLELRASAGLQTHPDAPHARVRVGEFKIGRIAENRRPHLTNDILHDPDLSDPEWARREGLRAFAGYPLIIEGRVLGVLGMFARHTLSDAVLADLAPIADSLAQCIERKRAEGALLESETLKGAILATSLDGFILMDAEGRIADWNGAAERIFGRSREDALGRSLGETIVPERLRERHRAGLTRYVETRQARILGKRYELPALRADGSEFPSEISINHIPGTEPPLFAGHVRDISDRKTAEAALAASEERLRLVLESATDLAILTLDLSGRVTLWNPGAANLFGWPAEEIMGQPGAIVFTEEDRAAGAAEAEMRTAAAVGHAEDERWHLRRDGSRFFASGIMMRLLDDTGATVGFLKVARDRTEQQLAEQERARLLRDTEEARAEAERARGIAESASKAKDDFLATLSHELRTPLTPVLMSAGALREDDRLPPDVREQLGMMERNIALEARLIDDLLDLTRIAEGKLPLRLQPCDAHSLISVAIEIVRDDAQMKGIAMQREFTARRSGLVADPTRFQQVVWNLLRNAVKFTPHGGRIVIRTRNETGADGAARLHIEVSDSGIGIDSAALEKIFLPFEQAGLTGDHRFGGMGLGLAIARAILDLHGGRITAESGGLDRGATFTVELPGAIDPPHGVNDGLAPAPEPLLPGMPQPPAVQSVSPLKLLLVEDHEPTLQVLSKLLARAGHSVTPCRRVADALKAAAAGPFDVVISDLGLPDGTGTDLMRELRDTHNLRGIALSGYGMEDDVVRARAAGFSLHLTKPVDIHQLHRALRDVTETTAPERDGA